METSEGQRKSSSGRGFDSEWCEPYAAHTTRQQPMFVVTARYALKRQGSQEAFCAQLELSRGVSQSHPLVFARRTEKKKLYIYIYDEDGDGGKKKYARCANPRPRIKTRKNVQ